MTDTANYLKVWGHIYEHGAHMRWHAAVFPARRRLFFGNRSAGEQSHVAAGQKVLRFAA